MVWGAVAGIGLSLIGGAMGAAGARSAARAERARQRRVNAIYQRFYGQSQERSQAMAASMGAAGRMYRDINGEFVASLNRQDMQINAQAAQAKARADALESVAAVMDGQPQAKAIDQAHVEAISKKPGGLDTLMNQIESDAGMQSRAEGEQQIRGERGTAMAQLEQDVNRQQQDFQIGQAMSERDLQMALQPLQSAQNTAGDDMQFAGALAMGLGPMLANFDRRPTATAPQG